MYLNRDISYDISLDQVVGPHQKSNLLILRGIFTKYTLPIWYGYDTPMTPSLLNEIIMKIQSFGFHVTGITCDNYPDNQALARDLGITDELPRFPNPSPDKKGEFIYFLFDVVHCLKLLRNHLLDQGTVQHYYLFKVLFLIIIFILLLIMKFLQVIHSHKQSF